MPKYIVTSGDFEVTINRRTARMAARDAIALLKDSDEAIELGLMTGVCPADAESKALYLSTIVLMEENGIKFRMRGEYA